MATFIPVFAVAPGGLRMANSRHDFESISVATMGLAPWFNAVVLLLLLRVVSSTVLERSWVHPERWVDLLTLPLAAVQAYGLTVLWQHETPAILSDIDGFGRFGIIMSLTATTLLLVLLGHTTNVFGLGYSRSPFLFYVITLIPDGFRAVTYATRADRSGDFMHLVAALAVVAALVLGAALTAAALLAFRPLGQQRGRMVVPFLPGGVILPVLFADSTLFLPLVVANYLAAAPPGSDSERIARFLGWFWSPTGASPLGTVLYLTTFAALVTLFSVFLSATRTYRTKRARAVTIRLTTASGACLAVSWIVLWYGTPALTRYLDVPFTGSTTWPIFVVGLAWPTFAFLTAAFANVRAPANWRTTALWYPAYDE